MHAAYNLGTIVEIKNIEIPDTNLKMASLCREPRPLRKEWGWAKCALYAARKEFELLKLLSTADEKVVAMARTMGQAAVIHTYIYVCMYVETWQCH